MKKLLAAFVVLGLVACNDSVTEPEVTSTDSPIAIPAPQFNTNNAAWVVNWGRDGSFCAIGIGGILAGLGQQTHLINAGGVEVRRCAGDWLLAPPARASNQGLGGCAVGTTGRLTITPGGRFSARCTPDD